MSGCQRSLRLRHRINKEESIRGSSRKAGMGNGHLL
jgi:hypothetical protein